MKRLPLFFFFFVIWAGVSAQHKVKFILKEKTAIKHDSIYVTGTFTNWDSSFNSRYRLSRNNDGDYSITLDLKPGSYRYKYTRGNWYRVEKNFMGNEVADRIFTLRNDTVFYDTVSAWRDEIISDKWHTISKEKNDSLHLLSLFALANIYGYYPEWYQIDSSFYYISKTLLLLQSMKAGTDDVADQETNLILYYAQEITAGLLRSLGNFSKELELRFDNLRIAEKLKDVNPMADAYIGITSAYASMQDYNRMLAYSKKLYLYITQNKSFSRQDFYHFQCLRLVSLAYFKLNKLDSALYFVEKISDPDNYGFDSVDFVKATKNQLAGDIYFESGKDSLALLNYKSVLPIAYPAYAYEAGIRARYGLARIYYKKGLTDSALSYGKKALQDITSLRSELQVWGVNANSMLAEFSPFIAVLYKALKEPDSAYYYLQLSVALKDSLFNLDKIQQFQNHTFNESLRAQQQEQEIRMAKQQYKSKVRTYLLIGGLALLSLLVVGLYRNSRQKQKAKSKIEKAYSDLKSTQAQLIQSEKMASLGELTAGIAHEIQNPLNFVNNFSEVNKELLDEMKNEMDKGNVRDAKAIANDVIENEGKINHHGKRADAIVKNMLQHSRSSSGAKEPTDVNVLADEYLRLAYHGLRAKDKSFNATMKTDFDESIGNINIVPQDVGRVILNLITNAFYAVTEKKKQLSDDYEPTVSVSTKKTGDKILISVKDNGNGISQKVLDKIFQPFFTTKPTGQGTGLGLSLSYDIVKAHGGELKVDTKEGEYAEFIVTLQTSH